MEEVSLDHDDSHSNAVDRQPLVPVNPASSVPAPPRTVPLPASTHVPVHAPAPGFVTSGQTARLLPLLRSPEQLAALASRDQNPAAMSLGERERLLQQQISRLLPALQQPAANPAHGHTHAHLPTGHPPPPPPPPGHAPDMAIDMEAAPPADSPPEEHAHSHARGRRGPARRQLGDTLQGLPGLAALLRNFEGAVPFMLLLFAKVMYNHRLGLLVFIAMFGTFYYANSSLKKLIALRDNQTWAEALSGYIWIFGFLSANILFIYFVFADEELYKCLYLRSPNIAEMDLWMLLWLTVITDFVVKFGTIAIKSLVAILPKHMMPFKKKGKYFLFLEMLSQCYRCVLPVPLWSKLMLENKYGGEWVAYVLFVAYCCCKAFHLRKKTTELRAAFTQIRVDVSFGTAPSRDEVKTFDNTCPICQDLFTEPVKLTCNHVFCDDCICMWLDREKTCPMCRAHIVDNPVWRDGATAAIVQFY